MKKKKQTKTIFETKNISEIDFINALNNVTKKLVYRFKFGYHTIEDIKQQAAIFAMEGLKNYDSSRPLENFLWTHIRNRLFNYKRDNYHRPDNVCESCPFFDRKKEFSSNQCKKFINKMDCEIYSESTKRNNLKKNIMHPSNIETLEGVDYKNNFLDNISNKEIISIIEDNISTKYREYYLKLRSGVRISKTELNKLKEHILYILNNYGS